MTFLADLFAGCPTTVVSYRGTHCLCGLCSIFISWCLEISVLFLVEQHPPAPQVSRSLSMKAAEGNGQLLQLMLHKYIPCFLLFLLVPVLLSHFVPGEQGRAIVLNRSWPFAWEYNPPLPLGGQQTVWAKRIAPEWASSSPPDPGTQPATIPLPPLCGWVAFHLGPVMWQFILWESVKLAWVSTATIETQFTLPILARECCRASSRYQSKYWFSNGT